MPITLTEAALNLLIAMLCGAFVGLERQARQRMAGLRTNALVATGSAAFVVYSLLYPDEIAQTRVAAQVVSGIGFLGAGIMFRQGFQVHGLNTAATLWCSAAVGVLAGTGAPLFAVLLTGIIVFINLGLRPVVKWIKRRTGALQEVMVRQDLRIVLAVDAEKRVRQAALAALGSADICVTAMRREEEAQGVSLVFQTEAGDELSGHTDLQRVLASLLADPGVLSAEISEPGATVPPNLGSRP